MNCVKGAIFFLSLGFFSAAFSVESTVPAINNLKFSPVEAIQGTWVFSGTVVSESGETYGYYFQIRRNNSHFHSSVALVDEANQQVIFHEDSEADLDLIKPYDWRVGHAFLRFNAINDSWIFGAKLHDNLGFNFKVDMLKQFAKSPNLHHLRPGVTMMVTETGELNGHVLTGESHPEQFVRADDAWFREIWKTTEDVQLGSLTSVLCRFNDGTGFYSVSLKDPDAQSGSVSGWYDANGTRQAMSQFIQVSPSKKENLWRIHSQSPSLDLVLLSPIHHANGVAGFVEGSKKQGFCVVNKE